MQPCRWCFGGRGALIGVALGAVALDSSGSASGLVAPSSVPLPGAVASSWSVALRGHWHPHRWPCQGRLWRGGFSMRGIVCGGLLLRRLRSAMVGFREERDWACGTGDVRWSSQLVARGSDTHTHTHTYIYIRVMLFSIEIQNNLFYSHFDL